VLIPRPETEVLVSEAISGSRPSRVLDLCTGSGCIAWTLALEMPGTEVVAVDISCEALKVASSQEFSREMAKTGAFAPEFIQSDVLAEELDPAIEGKFDILVSNPPYVMNKEKELMRANVLDHEPHLALFVPDDDPLLFYRAIAGHASRFLSPEGFGLVEINEALGEETADVFRASGFEARVIRDLSDKDRFVRFEFMKK
jgi:release factor glutamine methyltransferase